jgi:hypothetical protein
MDDNIADALARLLEDAFTRKPPSSVRVRAGFLVDKVGLAQAAALLGVKPDSVRRYLRGTRKNPPALVAQRLEKEVRARWQPQVRARAARQLAESGLDLETRARFGYTGASGTSDDSRDRLLSEHLPPEHARPLIDAYLAHAGDAALNQITAAGLADIYFRDGGRRAHGLVVEFDDIEYVQFYTPA